MLITAGGLSKLARPSAQARARFNPAERVLILVNHNSPTPMFFISVF
jgi:hypothetical protein